MHLTEDEEQFLRDFENCSLPEECWTHHAHVRVAWLYLAHLRPQEALEKIRTGILRYNTEVLDRRTKYHETVTVAFTRIIADRAEPRETWHDFELRNTDLLEGRKTILMDYYSTERLMTEEARQGFVEPDLLGLPAFA